MPVSAVLAVVLPSPVEHVCYWGAAKQTAFAVSVVPCQVRWQTVGVVQWYCGSVLQSQEAGSQSHSLGWWA